MTTHGTAFFARVCGLVIHADAPISGLRPLDVPEAPDLWVRMRGSFDPHPVNEPAAPGM